MAFEMFRALWAAKEQSVEQDKEAIQRQISQIERKSTQLLDRLVESEHVAP